MRVILWTMAAIVSSIANGKFLLWQNDPYFAYLKSTSRTLRARFCVLGVKCKPNLPNLFRKN